MFRASEIAQTLVIQFVVEFKREESFGVQRFCKPTEEMLSLQ